MPEVKKNSWVYNFFSLGIVQAFTSLLQLLIIPFVIRKIGVDGFGVVAVAQVTMFYLSTLTEYGFSQTATREISLNRENRQVVSVIFFRVIFCKLILCCCSFGLFMLLFSSIGLLQQHSVLYLAGFMFVIGQAVLINWFLTGVEQIHLMAFIALVARLIFAVCVFLFIRSKADAVLYLFFLGGGNFVMGLISIFLMVRKYKLVFSMPTKKDILDELRKGWQITVTNLSNNICQYSSVFILRYFTNDLVTGYYSVAERVYLTLRQMLGVFSQVVYPQVCLVVTRGRDTVSAYFKRVFIPFLAVLFTGCIVLFLLSPFVVHFFIHQKNASAIQTLRIFSVVLIIACLAIPATLLLLATDQRQNYFRVFAAGAVFNILTNSLLTYLFHATGTAIALLITELFILAGLTLKTAKLDIFNKQPAGVTDKLAEQQIIYENK